MHHHHRKHKCCPLDINISRWLTPRIPTRPDKHNWYIAVHPPVVCPFPLSPNANNTTAVAEPNDQQMSCCPHNLKIAPPPVSVHTWGYYALTHAVAHPIWHKKIQTSLASTSFHHHHHQLYSHSPYTPPLIFSSLPLIDPRFSISSHGDTDARRCDTV